MAEYKHPEVLVSTEWAAQHLNDPKVRLVEVDVDTSAYDQGHIPGAVGWNWQTQLQDNVRRDLISKPALEQLLGKSGISNDTTVLLYGDNNNWFAAYALWQLKYYGHKDARLINGGRKKWLEEKRPMTTDAPKVAPATYHASGPDESVRARKEDVFAIVENRTHGNLVDVRSVDEFTGKIIAPPGHERNRAARRAHSFRGQRSLGAGSERRRHLQERGSIAAALWNQGHKRQGRNHCLLPHRRTQFAYLVRAEISAGLRPRKELRRLVDGMGKPGGRSHRKRERGGYGAIALPAQRFWRFSFGALL